RGRKRRQDRWQPCRKHRLSGARRTDHEQVMSAGGSNFERAFRAFLALYVCKVERNTVSLTNSWLRAWKDLSALEVVGNLNKRLGRDDLNLRAGPCGFGSAKRRANQSLAAPVGGDCCR